MSNDENLRVEYSQRFAYQAHLTDRRWKVNGIYFIFFGFSINALAKDGLQEYDPIIAISNIAIIIFSVLYDISIRNRLIQNMERTEKVAKELEIEAFVHFEGKKSHSTFRLKGNTVWFICIMITCLIFWIVVLAMIAF